MGLFYRWQILLLLLKGYHKLCMSFEVHEYPLQPIRLEQSASVDEPYGLIITEEDCNPETLTLPGPPKGVLSLDTTQARSPLPVGKLANTFSQEALTDAVKRCESRFNCASEMNDLNELSSSLVDRAAQIGVKELVTAYPPTGPVHETLEQARSDAMGRVAWLASEM